MATMHLHITPNRIISDIQKEFNSLFPFLKIEFFKQRPSCRTDLSARQLLPDDRKIGEGQCAITDGKIAIHEAMKVNELEKIFLDEFSLAVQVFRKSGKLWLETTMTNNWTLQRQNDHGEEISIDKKLPRKIKDDDLGRDAER